jgi:hypothetical protein
MEFDWLVLIFKGMSKERLPLYSYFNGHAYPKNGSDFHEPSNCVSFLAVVL